MSWASTIWCPCYIAAVVSSMADPLDFFLKALYLNLAVPRPYTRSKSWRSCQRFTTTRHHIMSWASMVWCPCYITVVVSSMADPLDFSWQLHTWTQPFHVLTDARNHDVHVNDSRPQGIISCQEQAWFVVHATSPSLSRRWQTHQIFLESFIQHLWRFTFYKTLKIMMFMSTTNDHKALYHVLSEHDLAPKLHRCRCLNDGRPIRSFLKSSYWNSDVSRPFKRSKSWQIMTFMSTTNDHKASCHVLSKHDLVAKLHRCPCQVDGTPIRVFLFEGFKPELRLSTFYQTLEIMMFMSTTNDHKASYHVLSKQWFGAQATSLSLSRRWQTLRIFLDSFILELSRFTSLQTLEIMTFMSTIHDHKAAYHVLSKHDLFSMLHRRRCLVDGRPIRYFLKALYLNSAVSRPDTRLQSWRSCQRFNDHEASCHVLSKHDLVSMLHHRRCLVDGRPIRYFLKASYLNLDVSRPFRRSNHDVHVNDHRPQGIISCLEQVMICCPCYIAAVGLVDGRPLSFFFESFIFELRRFTTFQTLKIMMFMSTTNDQKASYHVLSKHDLAPMLHRCCCLVDVRPFRFFFDSFILELGRFTSFYRRFKIMTFMSTIQRPQGIITCLEQALICCSMLHRRRCLVDGRPIRYFFESFILELSRFTSLQTLEIMTFMSTIHDHKASYHVLSKHVLVPMLHHCRSLVDGRPFRFFLTTSYLNSAVSRPYRRSKSWGSCQRFTTTGIISCQEQAWFVVHATSPSLSRRWQTHQIFLESFIQHLWRFTFYKTLKIMMFMSTTNDHKALYHVLSEHDLAPKLHRCRCLVVAHPSDLSWQSSYWNSDVSRPYRRSKSWQIMTFMSTTNDHKASCHVLSKHDLVAKLHRCRCQVDGTPIRVFFFEGFKPEPRVFTFYQTLKIMMFMSTTNDHKASYHVLSKHDLAPKLHRCRCLVDGRPFRFFITASYLSSAVFTSLQTLEIMTFMSTIHDHKAS